MAYMNQERKAAMAPAIKAVLKKHGMKGSIGVQHHSTLVVTVSEGKIDFGVDCRTVNEYHIEHNYKNNKAALAFLTELKSAMMVGNHDNSDAQSDYFDVGWYININIGKYNKPYVLKAE